jgi:uncharacterized protein (DUF924 family)
MTVERRLLDFWFWPKNHPRHGQVREVWFKVDPAFDAELRARFMADYKAAAAGELDSLAERPEGALTLALLFDQVPRNLFRGEARAFATDERARAVADLAFRRGFERRLLPVQRLFFATPFVHSERLEDQRRALKLYADLRLFAETRDAFDAAIEHFEIIARFGRFPHRNRVLGRPSTPEEEDFLARSNKHFGTAL